MLETAFIEDLASKAPTPGGGSASAYAGVLATSLASMVGNLTVGKKRYADVEAEVYINMEHLADLRERLIELVEEDTRAFAPLARAYGMPRETPAEQAAKEEALQGALVGACEVPLDIMKQCARVIEINEFLAYNGSRMVLSDVGVSLAFAKAALNGASLNVFINTKSMTDKNRAARYNDLAVALIEDAGCRADELYAYVLAEIR